MARPLLMLIDGSHAVFRAFFAVRNLTSPAGEPTGAVFGFSSMLLKLIRERKPTKVGVCFDTSGPTHRHHMDPNYKANRPDMPPELQVQWPICQEVATLLGLPVLRQEGLEADDIIATLAHVGRRGGYDVLVVSGDKDLMQLVVDGKNGEPWIAQLDDGKGLVYDEAGVQQKWGLPPTRIGDLLAIMGDSVDNIPGVKGIGEKGAVKLLEQWGTFEAIWQNLDNVQPPRTKLLLEESRAQAMLARELVKLHDTADLTYGLEALEPKAADRPALAARFAQLGFRRLTAEYLDSAEPEVTAADAGPSVRLVQDAAALDQLETAVRQTGRLAILAVSTPADVDRLRPTAGQVVGLALAPRAGQPWYIPLAHQPQLDLQAPNLPLDLQQGPLAALLADPTIHVLGCTAKYEDVLLRRAGLPLASIAGDIALGSYLIDPEAHNHSMAAIVRATWHQQLPEDEVLLGKGKNQQSWDQLRPDQVANHLGPQVARIPELIDRQWLEMDTVGVLELYRNLERPLARVLAKMEATGVLVDKDELGRQSLWLGEQIALEEAQIHELAGQPFSVGSPKQLGEVLFDKLGLPAKKKTQTGFSTDQSVLEGLLDVHPIAAKVLRWRQLSKLKSTYTDLLPTMISPETGRVHTFLQHTVAATGRLSSTEPNLQNIPIRSVEGRRIRQAFVAPPGHVLLSADYSQIELRVMAHLAADPGLLQAFAQGADIHRETAARMFNLLPDLVSPEQRSAAKTINFGILYGMGPQRLSREIGVSLKEAKSFIERYFERFPAVHAWMERTLQTARETDEVRTLWQRRRLVPGVRSASQMDKAAAERVAINTPVQGSAADLIKLAMLAVDKGLTEQGLQAKLLLQVHDELLLEVPDNEVEAVKALVVHAMVHADVLPDGSRLSVPLRVDARTGLSWSEAH